MSLAMSEFYDRIPSFKHAPLDHTRPSIRIMRVLPNLSPEGFLQCVLTHGSTDDDYTCLSYTWGDESTTCPILMDGQLFFVRQNLLNFLHVVRNNYSLRPFWVDAVCIDQSSNAERNHQVAQMGTIYTAAAHVIIWLGQNSKIARYLHVWNQYSQPGGKLNKRNKLVDEFMRTQDGWIELANHAYWTRAWITQEIAHSRTLSLLADGVEVHNLEDIDMFPLIAPTLRKADERFVAHIAIALHHIMVQGATLSSLLQSLPYQECQNARDRVYSLLGLAADGADVCVDYGSSNVEFVLVLLKVCRDMVCLCGLLSIFSLLGGMQELPAELPTESYSVKATVYTTFFPWEASWLAPKKRQTDDLLSNRKDTCSIDSPFLCTNKDLYGKLEVFDCGASEKGEHIGRFRHDMEFSYEETCGNRSSCYFSEDCACTQPWWPGSECHSERGAYYDRKKGSWHPSIGATHQKTLIWYREPGTPCVVSNWFRVGLQPKDSERLGCYNLDIPMQVLWAFAHQSMAFNRLDAYFKSKQSTAFQPRQTERSVICTQSRSKGSDMNILQDQTVLKDVWSHEYLNGFVREKGTADTS